MTTGTRGKVRLVGIEDYRHLRDYGYGFRKTEEQRSQALRKAVKGEDLNWVIRRLNALRVLFKNTEPQYSKKAEKDLRRVQASRKA